MGFLLRVTQDLCRSLVHGGLCVDPNDCLTRQHAMTWPCLGVLPGAVVLFGCTKSLRQPWTCWNASHRSQILSTAPGAQVMGTPSTTLLAEAPWCQALQPRHQVKEATCK